MTEAQPLGRPLMFFTGFCICLAMLFGGATTQGQWTDYLLYVAFAPFALFGLGRLHESRMPLLGKCVVLLVLAASALQFLPIAHPINPFLEPNNAVNALSPLREVLSGGQFWSPVLGRSLESALFTISLLGFAIFVSRLSDFDQARLVRFFIVGIFLNVAIALIQTSYNKLDSSSLFFPYTVSVGVFANENHFSALIYCAIVLTGFQFIFLNRNRFLYFFSIAVFVFILFAYNSRAGMIISLLLSVPVYLVFVNHQSAKWQIVLAEAIIVAIPFILLFYRIADVNDGTREALNAVTLTAAIHYFPFGSGLGSFVYVYPMFDASAAIGAAFVNHAHNDWLELLLELGLIFVVIAVLLIATIYQSKWRNGLSSLAILIFLSLILHSFVDYPIRTMSLGVIFSFALGILVCQRDIIIQRPPL